MSKHPGIAIVAIDRELSPADAGKILGISRPTVVRLMQAGKLPFRFEGKHHRCKLEDVLRLQAAGERRPSRDRSMSKREVEELVLGTTNAPYKRAITATELTRGLVSGKSEPWTVHVATFFTEVKPELILKFAEMHGISRRVLASTYRAMKATTGEATQLWRQSLASWRLLLSRTIIGLEKLEQQGQVVPDWILGGGTALLLHSGHRLSKDIGEVHFPNRTSTCGFAPRRPAIIWP